MTVLTGDDRKQWVGLLLQTKQSCPEKLQAHAVILRDSYSPQQWKHILAALPPQLQEKLAQLIEGKSLPEEEEIDWEQFPIPDDVPF